MPAPTHAEAPASWLPSAQDIPRLLLAPVPLFLLQPLFDRMAAHVARAKPEVFERLGPHAGKRFLVDPIDLPFVLLLQPRPHAPSLKPYRRSERPLHDAGIAGTFLDLLDMIDGRLDGDALFFSRDLRVTGDTEAVVALRNALDDLDGSVVDTVTGAFGPLSAPARFALEQLRNLRKQSHD